MKFLVDYVYRKYRKDILARLMKEAFGEIPDEVEHETLEIFASKYKRVRRWFQWQAFSFQKKAVEEPAKAEIYYHWILLINLQLKQLDKVKIKDKKEDDEKADVVIASDLSKDLEGVTEFLKNGKNRPKI